MPSKTVNTSQEFIEEIKQEMLIYYNVDVSDDQIIAYVKQNKLNHFDTWEREDFINSIAIELIGMPWPMNGDSEEYKKEFYSKLDHHAKERN